MKTIKYVSLMLIAFISIMGCSGSYGKLKNQSRADSKVTQQELIENWSDYHIWFRSAVIVFDPKNDDRKILLGGNWGTVKDQETWTEIVKANTTSHGNISPVWASYSMTGVREIWSPDNRLYGFIINQEGRKDWVIAKLVDENTIRLSWQITGHSGGP